MSSSGDEELKDRISKGISYELGVRANEGVFR